MKCLGLKSLGISILNQIDLATGTPYGEDRDKEKCNRCRKWKDE